MEADPSVYHPPALGREEITVFPGTLATTSDNMPTQHLLQEIPSAPSSFVNPFFWGRALCTGGGFRSIRHWEPQASPSHGAGMGPVLGSDATVPCGDAAGWPALGQETPFGVLF